MTHYSAELVHRCELQRRSTATTTACAVLGAAVDAGIIELGELLDLVKSCSDAAQLGDALCMLAATVPAVELQPVGGDAWTS